MFSTTDTIVAIATPAGRGGIGVVRISGPDAQVVARALTGRAEPLLPRHATLVTIRSDACSDRASACPPNGRAIDHAIVTLFQRPSSYTGEDVIEVSAHGSPLVLKSIVAQAIGAGARLAREGEFTLRAFLNGRMDLTQAEAVADLVDAATPLQASAAFDQLNGTLTGRIHELDAALFNLIAQLEASVDFPEEGYHFVNPAEVAGSIEILRASAERLLRDARRGRLIREGVQVAIVGPPNAGKSSLFNALVGSPRAIVTEVAGTTRDLVTESVDVEGVRVTFVDTAGLRETGDPVEVEGVRRTRGAIGAADVLLVVIDQSQPRAETAWLTADGNSHPPMIHVATKSDLPPAWHDTSFVLVSSTTNHGIDRLRRMILGALEADDLAERPAITNVRHIALVDRALCALTRARDAALSGGQSMSEEFVLADLQDARAALEEITGARTSEDILAHIFERFCIGK